MAAQSGELHVSHGVKYEEHHGIAAHLHFGQELAFCGGSEMRVVAGMESALVVGAENKVGIATNSIFELGAEVKYVCGYAVEIAHEGGGAYEHAFTASAGSSKLGAFKSLKYFMRASVLIQVAAVATMLSLVQARYVQNKELIPSGETDAAYTLAWCQNTAGVIMFLGTVALNVAVRKLLHVEPLAAMTVNHESEAFIGVRGSVTHAGAAGLEFMPNSFKLSADKCNRDFRTSGHEVVGYKGDPDTFIKGSGEEVKIQAKEIKFSATSAPGEMSLGEKYMCAWFGNSATDPETEFQMGDLLLAAPGKLAVADKGIRLASSGAAVSMGKDWVRVSCDDGSSLGIEKNKQVKLGYANSSASVVLTQTEASLSLGNQSMKISATGVDIAGLITMLAPAVGVPDPKAKVTIASELAATILSNTKEQAQEIVEDATSNVYNRTMRNIAAIKRDIETKVSQTITQMGAV